MPPNLAFALRVCRFANADWVSRFGGSLRYMVDLNIHEAVDPGQLIPIHDLEDGETIRVTDVLSRLPVEDVQICYFAD